jgi:inorganic pyrophosphatase
MDSGRIALARMASAARDQLLAFVEIPKGSRNKYESDEELRQLVLDRFLSSSTVYPTDYGYLLGHRGRDGDPLDALVCAPASRGSSSARSPTSFRSTSSSRTSW